MFWALLVVVVVASAVGYAFRLPLAGGLGMWLGVGAPYVALAALAVIRLRKEQRLWPLLRFRPGDPSLGIGLGVVLLGAAWLVSRWLLPLDTVEHAWLLRVFLLIGSASNLVVIGALLVLVGCEELVWRGWIQTELSERFGARRGWVVAAALYALAHLPTLFSLEDAAAGKNPLVLLAALGCGLCWSFLRERTGRVLPGFFAHATFTYLATQSFWRFV